MTSLRTTTRLGIRLGLTVWLLVGVPTGLAQEPSQQPSLTGATWQWTAFLDSYQHLSVLTPNQTITFRDDGTFTARADCNNVLGSYTVDGASITLNPGPATLVACPEGSLGDLFVQKLLRVVEHSSTADGELTLTLAEGRGIMELTSQPTVTGTVSYRQRSALPAGSVIRVQVQDVSVMDARTVIIGEHVFTTAGEQVPLPFIVSFPASAVQEGRRYSLSARISDPEGRLLFVSDTFNPVITNGAPTAGVDLVLVPVQR